MTLPLSRIVRSLSLSCLLVGSLLTACKSDNAKGSENEQQERQEPGGFHDLTYRAMELADSLLTSLTLEERVGQCFMPSLPSSGDPETMRRFETFIKDYHIGGVLLLKGDVESAKRIAKIGEAGKIPLFIAIDAEWGLGMRLEGASLYPKNGRLPKETEETELYDYGREIAEECRRAGINMVLGPVIDISSAFGGVIGVRAFGDDPSRVAHFGVAYAKGLESGKVISVAKHFPGHGFTINDSHVAVAKLPRSISLLDSMELKPFREYINSGLSAIMAGHIQAPALDPSKTPASASIDILSYLLRDEMGFKGLIVTDAFDMGGARNLQAAEALKAGADIILCPEDLGWEFKSVIEAIKKGELRLETLNDRCRRILFTKFLFSIIQ